MYVELYLLMCCVYECAIRAFQPREKNLRGRQLPFRVKRAPQQAQQPLVERYLRRHGRKVGRCPRSTLQAADALRANVATKTKTRKLN